MDTFLSGFFHGFLLGFSLDCSFWRDALANFIPDLIVGGLIAWIITSSQSKKDREIGKLERELDKAEKALKYMKLIYEELEKLEMDLGKAKTVIELYDHGTNIILSTPVWDFISTEDFKEVVNLELLNPLIRFYDYFDHTKITKEDFVKYSEHTPKDQREIEDAKFRFNIFVEMANEQNEGLLSNKSETIKHFENRIMEIKKELKINPKIGTY